MGTLSSSVIPKEKGKSYFVMFITGFSLFISLWKYVDGFDLKSRSFPMNQDTRIRKITEMSVRTAPIVVFMYVVPLTFIFFGELKTSSFLNIFCNKLFLIEKNFS